MNHIVEPERETRVAMNVDVVVVGGGTAGFSAALAAARNGSRTLLIEQYGFLGGTMTAGGLNVILGFFAKERQVVGGIAQEIVDRLKDEEGTLGHQRREECKKCTSKMNCLGGSASSFVIYDPEIFKYLALRMVGESGVEMLLHTLVVDAVIEGGVLKGVVVENKSGRQAILADIVIDATGDGDVAARAGASFEKGRAEDGVLQTPSLVFAIGGVHRSDNRIRIYSDEQRKRFWIYRLPREGYYSVNSDCPATKTFEHFDATSAKIQTLAEVELREEAVKAIAFLRENIPGFESCYLVSTPPSIGVRETRRVIGEYVLTADDVLSARKFEDGIANGVHPLDIHDPFGAKPSKRGGLPCDQYYNVPYGCLVPTKVDNLLIAGRCISTTREANGSVRVMATCMALGQAAGTAAALCVKKGILPRELDSMLLKKTLSDQGHLVS